jgi:hypothetical protein
VKLKEELHPGESIATHAKRQAKLVRNWSKERSKLVDGIGASSSSIPAPKTERSLIAQGVTVAPPGSESMTV